MADLEVYVDGPVADDLRPWYVAAVAACERWYPAICAELSAAPDAYASRVKVTFEEDVPFPAAAAGATIIVNARHVRAHPADVGMLIHELVHVLQQYPAYDPSWLVEGIADWVRYHLVEREHANARPDLDRGDHTNGYWLAAALLGWLETEISPGIVRALDAALRVQGSTDAVFLSRTGRLPSALWEDFRSAQGRPVAALAK